MPSIRSLALDQRRQIGLVRDVEEDGEDADHEPEHEQLPDLQDAQSPEDRDQGEEHRASAVADDEDPPAAQPVDPDARRKREQDEGQELEHPEK